MSTFVTPTTFHDAVNFAVAPTMSGANIASSTIPTSAINGTLVELNANNTWTNANAFNDTISWAGGGTADSLELTSAFTIDQTATSGANISTSLGIYTGPGFGGLYMAHDTYANFYDQYGAPMLVLSPSSLSSQGGFFLHNPNSGMGILDPVFALGIGQQAVGNVLTCTSVDTFNGWAFGDWQPLPGNPTVATVDTTDATVTPLISYTIGTVNTLVTLEGVIQGFSDDNTVQYGGQFRVTAYLDGDLTDPATIVGTGFTSADSSNVLLAVTFSTDTNGLVIVNVTGLLATNMTWNANYQSYLTTYA